LFAPFGNASNTLLSSQSNRNCSHLGIEGKGTVPVNAYKAIVQFPTASPTFGRLFFFKHSDFCMLQKSGRCRFGLLKNAKLFSYCPGNALLVPKMAIPPHRNLLKLRYVTYP
jgi:hypothetical protein